MGGNKTFKNSTLKRHQNGSRNDGTSEYLHLERLLRTYPGPSPLAAAIAAGQQNQAKEDVKNHKECQIITLTLKWTYIPSLQKYCFYQQWKQKGKMQRALVCFGTAYMRCYKKCQIITLTLYGHMTHHCKNTASTNNGGRKGRCREHYCVLELLLRCYKECQIMPITSLTTEVS